LPILTELPIRSKTFTRQLATLLLIMLLSAAFGLMGMYQFRPNPYVQTVLSHPGDAIQGTAIFQMNCAGCHGFDATGNVGPNLHAVSSRKSPQALIEQVISGKTPPMPQFQPSPQEMADLLSYLESL
jgi:mono/diheme cytochrome c family protein